LKSESLYNLNAILPVDIAVSSIYIVQDDAHSRFAALSREYKYFIYQRKNPLLFDRAWHYPFRINENLLHTAAELVKEQRNFIGFSKRNTQVNNFNCIIQESKWMWEDECLVYNVKANRFLRGMVRALVSSMLKVARGTYTIDDFEYLFTDNKQATASFAAPAHGLFLTQVQYPDNLLYVVE
jgi:tRNA pseudouridine38-40 synthase